MIDLSNIRVFPDTLQTFTIAADTTSEEFALGSQYKKADVLLIRSVGDFHFKTSYTGQPPAQTASPTDFFYDASEDGLLVIHKDAGHDKIQAYAPAGAPLVFTVQLGKRITPGT